jgi:hypothetical protein
MGPRHSEDATALLSTTPTSLLRVSHAVRQNPRNRDDVGEHCGPASSRRHLTELAPDLLHDLAASFPSSSAAGMGRRKVSIVNGAEHQEEELAERARLSVRAITDLERGARWVPQWRRAIEGRSPLHQHLASIPAVRVPCHRSL